ncbi:uncharacterized protein LOC116200933 isoform X4 [Punica granatum]|uniref:Uncharacterized protein LOC116200933 isoform X4 n=1 Tax=Punica granatum TaxID=22663 RepID=A0A6P8CV24_PUNGR|nr:uncharacterized protein LOC116200933 isoform X4 [Punica granatum]
MVTLDDCADRGKQQSRKSTQKRQKQYFEQKKRRQQQTAGLDNFDDGMVRYGEQQEERCRSLDILSFLNFSTNQQQHRSEMPTAHDPTIASTDARICSKELKRAGPASPHNVETAFSEKDINKVGFGAPAGPGKRIGEEMDRWEIFPEANMSVLDLLGDDGSNQNPEVKQVNEDHVAFSVDGTGLGRVATETPIQSRHHQSRTFSNSVFSPSNNPSDCNFFADGSHAPYGSRCEVDLSIPDVNVACSLSPRSSFSQQTWNSFSIPEQETSGFLDSFEHNLDVSRQKLSSCCGKSYGGTDNISKNIWDAPRVSSDDDLSYGKSRKVSSIDCLFKWDNISGDYTRTHHRNQGPFDHAFNNVHLLKKRDTPKATDNFSKPESSARKFFADIDRSCTVMEEPKDSLSSKRGNMPNAAAPDAGLRHPGNKLAHAAWLGTNMPKLADHEELSFPFKSKTHLDSSVHLKKKLFYESNWLQGRALPVDSDFSSIHGARKKRAACPCVSPWNVDSINAYREIDFSADDQLPFDQSEHYPDSVSCQHSSRFISATFGCDKIFEQFNYHNFHCLPKDGSDSAFDSLYAEINYMASNLSHVAGSGGEMSMKERAGGENVPNFLPEQFEEFQVKSEAFGAKDCLSTENGQSGDDHVSVDINQVKDEASGAMRDVKTACHAGCSEKMSSAGISTREFKTTDQKKYLGVAVTPRGHHIHGEN